MPTTKDMLLAIVLPAMVALLIRLIGSRFGSTRQWSAPVALMIAMLIALFVRIGSLPKIPPAQTSDWLYCAAILAGVVGLLDMFALPRVVRAILMFVAAGGVGAMMLRFLFRSEQWTQNEYLTAIAAVGAAGMLWFATIEETLKDDSVAGFGILFFLGAGASMLMGMSGSVNYGMLGGAVTASIVAVSLVRTWSPRASLSPALVAPFVIIIFSLLLASRFVSELSPVNFVVLAAAPLMTVVGRFIAGENRGWGRTVLSVTSVLIPLAVVAGITAVQFRSDMAAFE